MQDDNARYRSLVLSHLYVTASRSRTAIDKLPPDTLSSLGVSVVEGPARCRRFIVEAPAEEGALKDALERLENDFRANSHMFPKGGQKKWKGNYNRPWPSQKGRKRVSVEHEIIEDDSGDSW